MSRSRLRMSRVLLVLLAASVAIFVITFVVKQRQNRAGAAAVPAGGAGSVSGDSSPGGDAPQTAPSDEADAVVTQTPTRKAGSVARPVIATASTQPGGAPGRPAPSPVTSTVVLSSKPLADAKAEADAGKLLQARDIYNAALASGKLSAAEAAAAKEQLAKLNDTLVFSPRLFKDDPWGSTFTVPPRGVLQKIARRFDVTPQLLQRINGISDPRRLQPGQVIKVVRGPLHAVIDKSEFSMDLYFGTPGGTGSSYLTTYRVGLGKDDSTPTGKWLVEPGKKLVNPQYHSPRGEGIIGRDDPKNPLGEHWIALTGLEGQAVGKLSYGIHGTIEPDSIGGTASLGCIRMRNEDVERVFEMLVEGRSTVVVVE